MNPKASCLGKFPCWPPKPSSGNRIWGRTELQRLDNAQTGIACAGVDPLVPFRCLFRTAITELNVGVPGSQKDNFFQHLKKKQEEEDLF